MVIGLAFAGLLVFGRTLTAYAACSNPSPLPSGYAAPCPVFSVSPASIAQSGTLTLSAAPQPGTDYIYTTAYYAKGTNWLPVTLIGNNAAPSYSTGLATGSLNASILGTLTPGTNYVVLWDWLWDATAGCYKGPGLNQCNTGTWRLQSFTLTSTAYTYSQSAYISGCTTGCNNYYVSPTGSDSNNGTSPSTAWKTIAHADGRVSMGTNGAVVHVAAGTYLADITCPWGYHSVFCVRQGGTSPTVRLRYQCDAPATLAMLGTTQGCYLQQTPNITVNQFAISGGGTVGGSNNVDIVGFHIAPNPSAYGGIEVVCAGTGTDTQCPSGNSWHVIGNLIEPLAINRANDTTICNVTNQIGAAIGIVNAHSHWANDTQYIGNMIAPYGNAGVCRYGYSLYMDGRNQVAYNNIMWGSVIAMHVYDAACNERISNNIIIGPAAQTAYTVGILLWNSSSYGDCSTGNSNGHNTLDNNIVINTRTGIEFNTSCDASHPNLVSNNMMFGNTAGDYLTHAGAPSNSCSTIANAKTESPTATFVNYKADGTGDYHLKAGSAAINGGATACVSGGPSPCTPSTDFDGRLRPQGSAIDIGAYEQ